MAEKTEAAVHSKSGFEESSGTQDKRAAIPASIISGVI